MRAHPGSSGLNPGSYELNLGSIWAHLGSSRSDGGGHLLVAINVRAQQGDAPGERRAASLVGWHLGEVHSKEALEAHSVPGEGGKACKARQADGGEAIAGDK